MQELMDVVLPVFLVIAAGYISVWRGWFTDTTSEALMTFAQNFAIPCLLFLAIARLDLAQNFDGGLLVSYYSGALFGFVAGLLGARYFFHRPWTDSVAIGFVCLYSNSTLLGLAVSERAYGPETVEYNYAIIALHAPICYTIGIAAMEIARSGGKGLGEAMYDASVSLATNPLIIAISAGIALNLSGITLPLFATDAVEFVAQAGLPAAIFALGGVLVRYRPEGDLKTILYICVISLLLHPIITWTVGSSMGVGSEPFRAAVITAAMAPGVNGFIFANMYGVAKRVAASSVLFATAASVITAWVWLVLIP